MSLFWILDVTHNSQNNIHSPKARHTAPTREEILILNEKAKKAARAGDQQTTEYYRRQGVSLETIAYSIGLSGNKEYARWLLQQNPQSLNLATKIAEGAQSLGDSEFVRELVECWKADADIVKPSRSACGPFHNRRMATTGASRPYSAYQEPATLRYRRSSSKVLDISTMFEQVSAFFTPRPPDSNSKKDRNAPDTPQRPCFKRGI